MLILCMTDVLQQAIASNTEVAFIYRTAEETFKYSSLYAEFLVVFFNCSVCTVL